MADAAARRFDYDGDPIMPEFAGTNGSACDWEPRYIREPQVGRLLAQENIDLTNNPDGLNKLSGPPGGNIITR